MTNGRAEAAVAFEPLPQRTTLDAVVEVIRGSILSGQIAPGSPLRESSIARDLGISRAPLREALRILEEEGLVVRIPFRGAFVVEISAQRIAEISALRKVLEPYAIEQGLETLRTTAQPEMARLAGILREAAREKDVPKAIDAHLGLHRQFYEASGNEALLDIWHGWESQLRLFLAEDLRRFSDPMEMAADHEHLIALIEAGDLRAIKNALASHVRGRGHAGDPFHA